MCDIKKYQNIYHQIEDLEPEDTLELVLNAKSEEEKSFFEMIGDFLLQQKQKKVIERNLF